MAGRSLLVTLLLLFTLASTENSAKAPNAGGAEQAKRANPAAPKAGDLSALNTKIAELASKLAATKANSESALKQVETSTKSTLDALASRLTSLESNAQASSKAGNEAQQRVQELSSSLEQQGKNLGHETRQISSKLAAIESDLKSVQAAAAESQKLAKASADKANSASDADLSQFVRSEDFAQEMASLRELVAKLQKSQETQQAQDKKSGDASAKLEQIEKKMVSIDDKIISFQDTAAELTRGQAEMQTKLAQAMKKGGKADENKFKDLDVLLAKQGVVLEQIKGDVELVRNEQTQLQGLVQTVQAQTIGNLLQTSLNSMQVLAVQGFEIAQAQGEVFLAWSKKKGAEAQEWAKKDGAVLFEQAKEQGAILLEKGKELFLSATESLRAKALELFEAAKAYDYSWLTDAKQWKAFGKWVVSVVEGCVSYTQDQVIPALRTQSMQVVSSVQTVAVDFYQHRRENIVYAEVAKVVVPLFKQVEALPEKYYDVTLDVLMGLLVVIALLLARGVLLLMCSCVCPRVPQKVHEAPLESKKSRKKGTALNGGAPGKKDSKRHRKSKK